MKSQINREGDSTFVSRRELFGKLALPTIGAVLGTGLSGQTSAHAMPASGASTIGSLRVHVHNIRDHGAQGDGATLDTVAFNKAIEEAAAAGGGQVLVPPGRYLTGTIRLKSNITLMLEEDAEIIGTPDLRQYETFIPPKGNPLAALAPTWHRALLLGTDVEKVTITGRGCINGNNVFDPKGEENMRGPHAVLFGNSRDITLRDISIRHAGNYAVLLEFTSDVDVHAIKITGGWDGVHFRGWKDRPCRNISITDCELFTGDDSIAGCFWEKTLIAGCIINSSCNGIRLIGPAQSLIVHDCLFFGAGRFEHRTSRERHRTNMLAGILLQPGSWDPTEGLLDDVQISNITMHDIATPLSVTLTTGNTAGRISVNRLTATGVYQTAASIESWAEEPVGRISLREVNLEFLGGGRIEKAPLPVRAPTLDARVLPVWGLFVHRVQFLQCQHMRLNLIQPDARPAFMADNVERIELDGFGIPRGDARPMVLSDVRDLSLRGSDLNIVTAKCVDLKAVASPLTVTATIKNQSMSGLASIQVTLDGQQQTRWVDMRPGEQQSIVFEGWLTPSAGLHNVQCGDIQEKLYVPK